METHWGELSLSPHTRERVLQERFAASSCKGGASLVTAARTSTPELGVVVVGAALGGEEEEVRIVTSQV